MVDEVKNNPFLIKPDCDPTAQSCVESGEQSVLPDSPKENQTPDAVIISGPTENAELAKSMPTQTVSVSAREDVANASQLNRLPLADIIKIEGDLKKAGDKEALKTFAEAAKRYGKKKKEDILKNIRSSLVLDFVAFKDHYVRQKKVEALMSGAEQGVFAMPPRYLHGLQVRAELNKIRGGLRLKFGEEYDRISEKHPSAYVLRFYGTRDAYIKTKMYSHFSEHFAEYEHVVPILDQHAEEEWKDAYAVYLNNEVPKIEEALDYVYEKIRPGFKENLSALERVGSFEEFIRVGSELTKSLSFGENSIPVIYETASYIKLLNESRELAQMLNSAKIGWAENYVHERLVAGGFDESHINSASTQSEIREANRVLKDRVTNVHEMMAMTDLSNSIALFYMSVFLISVSAGLSGAAANALGLSGFGNYVVDATLFSAINQAGSAAFLADIPKDLTDVGVRTVVDYITLGAVRLAPLAGRLLGYNPKLGIELLKDGGAALDGALAKRELRSLASLYQTAPTVGEGLALDGLQFGTSYTILHTSGIGLGAIGLQPMPESFVDLKSVLELAIIHMRGKLQQHGKSLRNRTVKYRSVKDLAATAAGLKEMGYDVISTPKGFNVVELYEKDGATQYRVLQRHELTGAARKVVAKDVEQVEPDKPAEVKEVDLPGDIGLQLETRSDFDKAFEPDANVKGDVVFFGGYGDLMKEGPANFIAGRHPDRKVYIVERRGILDDNDLLFSDAIALQDNIVVKDRTTFDQFVPGNEGKLAVVYIMYPNAARIQNIGNGGLEAFVSNAMRLVAPGGKIVLVAADPNVRREAYEEFQKFGLAVATDYIPKNWAPSTLDSSNTPTDTVDMVVARRVKVAREAKPDGRTDSPFDGPIELHGGFGLPAIAGDAFRRSIGIFLDGSGGTIRDRARGAVARLREGIVENAPLLNDLTQYGHFLSLLIATGDLSVLGGMAAGSVMPAIRTDTVGRRAMVDENRRSSGYFETRGLKEYDSFTIPSQMGPMRDAVKRMLDSGKKKVRIMEFGPGQGRAAKELKDEFGDRVIIDAVILDAGEILPECETAFRNVVEADIKDVKELPSKEYDLILSIYGASFHADNPKHVYELAGDHLALGGEAFLMTMHDGVKDKFLPLESPAYNAASRALGLEISSKQRIEEGIFTQTFMERTGTTDTKTVMANATDLGERIHRDTPLSARTTAADFAEFMNSMKLAAARIGEEIGLKIEHGFRMKYGDRIRTDWENLEQLASDTIDEILRENNVPVLSGELVGMMKELYIERAVIGLVDSGEPVEVNLRRSAVYIVHNFESFFRPGDIERGGEFGLVLNDAIGSTEAVPKDISKIWIGMTPSKLGRGERVYKTFSALPAKMLVMKDSDGRWQLLQMDKSLPISVELADGTTKSVVFDGLMQKFKKVMPASIELPVGLNKVILDGKTIFFIDIQPDTATDSAESAPKDINLHSGSGLPALVGNSFRQGLGILLGSGEDTLADRARGAVARLREGIVENAPLLNDLAPHIPFLSLLIATGDVSAFGMAAGFAKTTKAARKTADEPVPVTDKVEMVPIRKEQSVSGDVRTKFEITDEDMKALFSINTPNIWKDFALDQLAKSDCGSRVEAFDFIKRLNNDLDEVVADEMFSRVYGEGSESKETLLEMKTRIAERFIIVETGGLVGSGAVLEAKKMSVEDLFMTTFMSDDSVSAKVADGVELRANPLIGEGLWRFEFVVKESADLDAAMKAFEELAHERSALVKRSGIKPELKIQGTEAFMARLSEWLDTKWQEIDEMRMRACKELEESGGLKNIKVNRKRFEGLTGPIAEKIQSLNSLVNLRNLQVEGNDKSSKMFNGLRHDFGNEATVVDGYFDLWLKIFGGQSTAKIDFSPLKPATNIPSALCSLERLYRDVAQDVGMKLLIPGQGTLTDALKNTSIEYKNFRDVRRVLRELVNNAIKYRDKNKKDLPEGMFVKVEVKIEDGNLVVEVSDNGIGMTLEQLTKYSRVEGFRADEAKAQAGDNGFGVGAVTMRALVEDMGGKMKVESAHGKGTKIIIEIPVDRLGSTGRGTNPYGGPIEMNSGIGPLFGAVKDVLGRVKGFLDNLPDLEERGGLVEEFRNEKKGGEPVVFKGKAPKPIKGIEPIDLKPVEKQNKKGN